MRFTLCLMVAFCLGCTSEPGEHTSLKFQKGQVVDLKIGGKGQIVEVRVGDGWLPYRLRIQTTEGPKYWWFYEFELEIK